MSDEPDQTPKVVIAQDERREGPAQYDDDEGSAVGIAVGFLAVVILAIYWRRRSR